uniref:Uncharacterized protein n=1 Tax=Sinocyclocheilus grahami TaxID=75366 RepID=A0A672QPD1_SINGR
CSTKMLNIIIKNHIKLIFDLCIAKGIMEKEVIQVKVDKEKYLSENCPPLSMPGSTQELQELCKKLHQQIDNADEERYDLESKVGKASKEVTSDTQIYLMMVTMFLTSLYTGFSELQSDSCLMCV